MITPIFRVLQKVRYEIQGLPKSAAETRGCRLTLVGCGISPRSRDADLQFIADFVKRHSKVGDRNAGQGAFMILGLLRHLAGRKRKFNEWLEPRIAELPRTVKRWESDLLISPQKLSSQLREVIANVEDGAPKFMDHLLSIMDLGCNGFAEGVFIALLLLYGNDLERTDIITVIE